jgi:hypothetical protein
MYRRLEQGIADKHKDMDEAEERIGSVSWATADNNRGDPLNLAICIPAQIKHRAYNKDIEEVQANDELWARITLEHILEDQELVDAMKGIVKDVLINVPFWNRKLDPESRLLKEDEDLIALILTSEEDVKRLEGLLVRWKKGTRVKTANLKRPKQVVPVMNTSEIRIHAANIEMCAVLESPSKLIKLMAHAMYGNVNPRTLDEVSTMMEQRRNHTEQTRRGPRVMSTIFTPRFKEGQVGAEARKRLAGVIDKQLLTKTIHGNNQSLRIAEALKFTPEMSRTKYGTFTKKGDLTKSAVKLANVQNQQIIENMNKMTEMNAAAMNAAREESSKARVIQAEDNAKTFSIIQTMQQTLASTVMSAVKSQEQFNKLQETQNKSVNIQMQQNSRQAQQQMAINSSRRKDANEKDECDDNVEALRRMVDAIQPAILKLESGVEEILADDEIEHDDITSGIKETGHAFINELIQAATEGNMEEKNIRKLTSKLKLLYSKLERENGMLGQITAHKQRYRQQSNIREDELVQRIEEEARTMNLLLQTLITDGSNSTQSATSREPAGGSEEHAKMTSSQFSDVTNQEEAEGKQETRFEISTEDQLKMLETVQEQKTRRTRRRNPNLHLEVLIQRDPANRHRHLSKNRQKKTTQCKKRNNRRAKRLERKKKMQH